MRMHRLLLTAWIGSLAVSIACGIETRSLVSPVLLPDGQEFKTWEKPLAFSKTYLRGLPGPFAALPITPTKISLK